MQAVWYDPNQLYPPAAFIIARGIVVGYDHIHKVFTKDNGGWRSTSKFTITLADGSIIPRGFYGEDPLDFIHNEIVWWHSSRSDHPDDSVISLAEIWDNELKHEFEIVIEDEEERLKIMDSYWEEQMKKKPEDRDV